MQLSVLFSALISFVILAAASPTPRAISIEELSSKREELDTDAQCDLLEEGRKPDELETNSVTYISYVTRDGLVIPEGITEKRDELDGIFTFVLYDCWCGNCRTYTREESTLRREVYDPREELAAAIDYVD